MFGDWPFGNRHILIRECTFWRLTLKPLLPLVISGREVAPLVEGGKGIAVSNGESSGAWVAAGGVEPSQGLTRTLRQKR